MIYEVISTQLDHGEPTEEYGQKRPYSSGWGSFATREEAEDKINRTPPDLLARWDVWSIKEIDQTDLFQIPPKFDWETRHKRFTIAVAAVENRPGTWNSTLVTVWDADTPGPVATYQRNYFNTYGTFEPFQQAGHHYALISRRYTKTAVLDLQSGEVIAEEDDQPFVPGYEPGTEKGKEHGMRYEGFCPVGFYVPDWWDIHDGSIQPGTSHWDADDEQPSGQYGFVWGCQWGDDSSWKIQYLDLSRITEGIITRDERFGYVELADMPGDPGEFIRIHGVESGVTFSVLQRHNLITGKRWDDE